MFSMLYGMLSFVIKSAFILGLIAMTFFFGIRPYYAIALAISDAYKKIKANKKNPHERYFNEYGFWLYCGLGGTGKTLSIVKKLLEYKKKYPKLWIVTNFECKLADQKLSTWKDLIEIENPNGSEYGVVFAFDEIHLTLNSQSFKSRPDDLLEYVSQQRKLHKQILGSAQVFTRVDKVLREQTNMVVECRNLFGRWIFNKGFHTEDYLVNAELKDQGVRRRTRAFRFDFIATQKLYDLYNTYEIMKPLMKAKSKSEMQLADLKRVMLQ